MTIGVLRGVPVVLHRTLLLMLAVWFVWALQRYGLAAAGTSMLWIFAFVGSVLVHELAHVEVARRFGIPTRRVVLHIVGGAAMMERRRVPPSVDAWVSLAGPLASLALGVLLMVPGWLARQEGLVALGGVNVLLGMFNLIPAFPMDGGRVLRAVLVHRWGVAVAQRWALGVGAAFAGAFALVGLWTGWPGLVLVAGLMGAMQWREAQIGRRVASAGGAYKG